MISVLILTLNEELNLPACLEAVRWSDDVVVFDSGSTDRTVEIARAAGARVIVRPFDNERDHRTASLQVDFKYPWVFNPDADEIPDAPLIEEMQSIVRDPRRAETAYRVRFRNRFMGRWLRWSSLYPTWIVRLFRPECISFQRTINLTYVIQGAEGRLKGHLDHYTFRKGLAAWYDKHNRYSSAEAVDQMESLAGNRGFRVSELFSLQSVRRRRALKELSFRLPFRPTLRFFYMYVLRLGLLDGRAGYHYCKMIAQYEHMMVMKIIELQRARKGLSM